VHGRRTPAELFENDARRSSQASCPEHTAITDDDIARRRSTSTSIAMRYGRGMKAIGARLARAANRIARRRGSVLADRHVRVQLFPRSAAQKVCDTPFVGQEVKPEVHVRSRESAGV
jgi:hypothetical protein